MESPCSAHGNVTRLLHARQPDFSQLMLASCCERAGRFSGDWRPADPRGMVAGSWSRPEEACKSP